MDIQQDSTPDAQWKDGKNGELNANTASTGLQNLDFGAARKYSDVTGTLTRYARIVRVFTVWYEAQYGDSMSPDVFKSEEVIGRYLQHCSARLSQSSVRRIRTALQMVAGESANTTVKAKLSTSGQKEKRR